MQNGLVSIIMPFKNTEAFLTECLQSIRNQAYREWELLSVDDHSTDGSWELLVGFAAKDPRIRVFKNEGNGIIPALQTGYAQSRGMYITRMDSDDKMPPHKLGWMVNALAQKGLGHLAVGKVRYFSHRGISNGYQRYEEWLNGLAESGLRYTEIYKECVVPSPCWMAHRNDFETCGAFASNRYPEDYDLTFRFYEKGLKCIPCDQVLHYWRDYDTRTSRTSEHYAQNYFLEIKLYYFLKLEYQKNRPLAVWGAGTKGKEIAKGLITRQIDFYWLCDNPKKIGKQIYGTEMLHYGELETLEMPQSIVTVANERAQAMIRNYFSILGHKPMVDYFFFC
ncbi:MAG: glycosyltransferase family 2 protein [Bacteroidota bacterium]